MRVALRSILVSTAAAAAVATTFTAPVAAETAPPATRIGVAVATLWVSPESPRSIDRLALRAPAKVGRWLRGMSTWQRRDLNGRVESQALYGQPVTVLQTRGGWSQVVLPTQPSPKASGGYPGWIPSAQLVPEATVPGASADLEAVVKRRHSWAFTTRDRSQRKLNLSYGTRLPVVAQVGPMVSVAGPEGDVLWVPAKRVQIVPAGEPARQPSRRAAVREAKRFLELPYLWGGTSGFGYDCSGLTHAIYAQLGITIPRDANPQFGQGIHVRKRANLRRGDLVFFRTSSGYLHHVGIYVGDGRMIHSPRTGQPVQYGSLTSGLWADEFAGGRRYI